MIETVQPNWNSPPGVQAFCTTRAGGHSAAPYDSFNLGHHVGDNAERVAQNRNLLSQALDLPAEPCWIKQTHSTSVVTLEQDDNRTADAAITHTPGIVAVVMTADCLPILICNHSGSEVAAVHAGWRGLQAGVIQCALDAMQSANDQLMAWIGPGISQACFEVGDEVYAAYINSINDADRYFSAHGPGHWLCDLAGLAQLVFEQQGVSEVTRAPLCSYRDDKRFYSYRRDATTGRMASLIWINPSG